MSTHPETEVVPQAQTNNAANHDDEDVEDIKQWHPFWNPLYPNPVIVPENDLQPTIKRTSPFFMRPLYSSLLLPNTSSDARDHLANERTFLSWLRLSMYLAIVSAAILVSFHLQQKPSPLERHLALPLGICFWVLSLIVLAVGMANYIITVTKYARKKALVQTGWRTQMVVGILAAVIAGCCGLFLGVEAKAQK